MINWTSLRGKRFSSRLNFSNQSGILIHRKINSANIILKLSYAPFTIEIITNKKYSSPKMVTVIVVKLQKVKINRLRFNR